MHEQGPDIPGSLEEERFDFRRTRLQLSGVPLQLYTYDNLVSIDGGHLAPLLSSLIQGASKLIYRPSAPATMSATPGPASYGSTARSRITV